MFILYRTSDDAMHTREGSGGGRPFTLQREVYELLEKGFLSPQNSLRPRAEEWFWTKWLDPFPGNLFLETCRGV